MIRGRYLLSIVAAALLPATLLVVPGAAQAEQGSIVEPRVVNGRTPAPEEATALVYVRIGSTLCSGTLVDPTHVITAGHCVTAWSGGVRPPGAFAIGWSADGVLPPSAWTAVSRVWLHPAYDSETFVNDIAVLTLTKPIPAAIPMPLASAAESGTALMRRSAVRAAGYGYTAVGGIPSNRSLVADLQVVSDRVCRASERTFRIGGVTFFGLSVDTSTAVCAIGVQRESGLIIDTCQGDSGGPLYADLGAGERLLGLVSVGVGCAGFDNSTGAIEELEEKTPGVYTRIAPYLEWLTTTVGVGSQPAAPLVTATSAGEDAIDIAFESVGTSNATGYRAEVTAPDATGGTCTASLSAPACTIPGLDPGVAYAVVGYAVGAAQQSFASPPVTVVAGTPRNPPRAPRIRGVRPKVNGTLVFRVTRIEAAAWTASTVVCRTGTSLYRADVVGGRARLELPQGDQYRCRARSVNALGAARSGLLRLSV